MKDKYLLLGYVTDAFSLDGTLKVLSKTDFADVRYQEGKEVYLYNSRNNQRNCFVVKGYRSNGQFDFVKLEGINTKEDALSYKGYEVQAIKDYQHMDKDTYYFVDLVGCKVLDDKGAVLGEVSLVEEFPAQLTLRVKRDNNQPDFLVPFVKAFIKNVDIKNKQITINVIGGLL